MPLITSSFQPHQGRETIMRSRHHRLIAITTTGALGALFALAALPAGYASASARSITAVPVRLPPDAARGNHAASNLFTIDCVRPGSCTAGGAYASRHSRFAPMVTSQVDGRWRRATEIALPGTPAASGL